MKHMRIFGKKSWKVFQCLVVLMLTAYGLVQAQAKIYLVNTNDTYKVLQLENNSQSNGTHLVLGDRKASTSALDDQILWIHDSETHTIRLAANPNKCIHRGDPSVDGSIILLYDYIPGGHPNQEWLFEDGRIKLKADPSYCIDLDIQNFSVGNAVKLKAVTSAGTWQKWHGRDKVQSILTADGQWHSIHPPGETYLDVAIPNPCPYPYLTIRARGGDGGFRSVKDAFTGEEIVRAKGGQGATIIAIFKIGTGSGELRPGGNIRLVIGHAGKSYRNQAAGFGLGSGGGGGTGVIYEAPGTRPGGFSYYPWEMLLIASGGGGAFTGVPPDNRDGLPGSPDRLLHDPNGHWVDENKTSLNTYDANGWGGEYLSGNGGGFRADDDPAKKNPSYDQASEVGAGFKKVDGLYFPIGGQYRRLGFRDARTDDYGGYGFGSGGYGKSSCGGGGGYSGGIWGGDLGGAPAVGGSSYVNTGKAVDGTIQRIKNGATSNPIDGLVGYIFTSTAPSTSYKNKGFEYGLQDVEILRSGDYHLNWQGDGNLVLYGPSGATWSSRTSGRGKDLAFQGDGNMVIYENGSVIWSSATSDGQHNGQGGQRIALTSDGSLTIQDQNTQNIWQATVAGTSYKYNTFEYGLQSHNVEILRSGDYSLKWQTDGNLVLYGPSGAVWASGTNGRGNKLTFQSDGNLVIYQNGTGIWDVRTSDGQHGGRGGRRIALSFDGSLTIQDSNGNNIWQGH